MKKNISSRFRHGLRPPSKTADTPFMQAARSEECLKCLLKIRHRKCESHKYIRVGGGYRHGYWYVKALLEHLELERQREEIRQKRLEAIKEKVVHAIRTYIRTKSGRLVKKIVFLSEEDYKEFKDGAGPAIEILKKYLSENEVAELESWDKDEVKAIKTKVRTKSGRTLEKIVYVNKEDYEAIKAGKKDPVKILTEYFKEEQLEVTGWEEAKMKTIKAFVRTKSGRVVTKVVQISEDDYNAMLKDNVDPSSLLKQYLNLEEGETLSDWTSAAPPKAITTKIRTKSGRIIEKTVLVSAEDYDKLKQSGADVSQILGQYISAEEGNIESWEKDSKPSMRMIKTTVRTKSGRLLEKEILMDEEEYQKFLEADQNPNFLKRFIDLKEGEEIKSWQKEESVYSVSSDEENFKAAESGQFVVGKDGSLYEVIKDSLTGKIYKKRVRPDALSDNDSGFVSPNKARLVVRDGRLVEENAEERSRRKQGLRNVDSGSDSDFSYRSLVSAGGTRHVKRRRRRADGTRSDSESYRSSDDEEGQARRRVRRRQRRHGAGSSHSYYSEKSEGGTRHVKRRRRRADGTYSASESYHSDDSGLEGGRLQQRRDKERRRRRHKRHGSDSDHSYFSEVSNGGTRHTRRRRRVKDKHGNVIGHESVEDYCSSDSSISRYTTVSDGKGGKKRIKVSKAKTTKDRQRGRDNVADFSDASSDSDAVDLDKMTDEERREYLSRKAARKAERQMRRREKYGDKFEEMLAKHEKNKRERKQQQKYEADKQRRKSVAKSMVTYAKGSKRDILEPIEKTNTRGLGIGHESWSKDGKKKTKDKDGYEADADENEDTDERTGKKKKHPGRTTHREGDYEYVKDSDGRVIKKRKKKEDGTYETDSEYEYDNFGNKTRKPKRPSRPGSSRETSDGDYFDADEDGRPILKQGKQKIDLSKLSKADLQRMGIDPTLSKQDIARKLKEKFGAFVKITSSGEKVATKKIEDYPSDVDTDDLADDSDLDVTTLSGVRRVNVMMRRGGQKLIDHMNFLIESSQLSDQHSGCNLDEKESSVDFLSHYRLVESTNLAAYARAFVVEDEDMDAVIDIKETRVAIRGVDTVKHMTEKQKEYVFKVLKIDDASQITFRMFAVITALSERVTHMDSLSKHLLEICDLLDIERKMDLYRGMFYCNAESERDANFIKSESLQIELIAGGLNWKQQNYIMERLKPNIMSEISFLDFICYIPLFMSMHDNIVDNPLDMSCDKYDEKRRRLSGLARQRDMNPLGVPLQKNSPYQLRQQAKELLAGKVNREDLDEQRSALLNKYAKLPDILS